MSSNSFFPSTEAGQIVWLTNYALKLPVNAAGCEISEAEITSTVTDAVGSRVRIDFKKYGHDGIWIESRINGGEWAFLAIDTVSLNNRL